MCDTNGNLSTLSWKGCIMLAFAHHLIKESTKEIRTLLTVEFQQAISQLC